uniref:Glycine-rich protein n=2 Tax=Solanum lycopersicum TaxID=4081 RepID=A0A3Q7F778_SOLLC
MTGSWAILLLLVATVLSSICLVNGLNVDHEKTRGRFSQVNVTTSNARNTTFVSDVMVNIENAGKNRGQGGGGGGGGGGGYGGGGGGGGGDGGGGGGGGGKGSGGNGKSRGHEGKHDKGS